jgi:endonuclease/exonuclease/phosphatase family metal-dependent hydrolase
MTFNIRYGTADDGENSWPNRRGLVADIIAGETPDVLAIQEGLAFQLEDLGDALAGYRKIGQHRDGGLEGEFSGLFVNEARVRILDSGEFWLSSAPDAVGSTGWDAALPRMAVWAEIEALGGDGRVRVYGTHFDHQGVVARLESARLITLHAQGGPPAVILGDLNATEDSEPLQAFYESGYRSAVVMIHPDMELGTFNGFRDPSGGDRIDHILVNQRLKSLRARIITERIDGVWPSDHFPVTAVLQGARDYETRREP